MIEMIPKTIHYCWFGDNPKSKLIKKCIESWKKFFPDYEIVEWNESNFDVNCCAYVSEAYEAKKWAYVSDYARCYILYHFGGLYFDTDVEFLKSPNNVMLSKNLVALEAEDSINTGLVMACYPHNDFCRWMLESYHNDHFCAINGTYYTVCQRATEYFKSKGFVEENRIQEIAGFVIYPTEYFCPYRYGKKPVITENTYSFHHYAASWLPWNVKLKRGIQKFIGKRGTEFIVRLKKGLRGYGKTDT